MPKCAEQFKYCWGGGLLNKNTLWKSGDMFIWRRWRTMAIALCVKMVADDSTHCKWLINIQYTLGENLELPSLWRQWAAVGWDLGCVMPLALWRKICSVACGRDLLSVHLYYWPCFRDGEIKTYIKKHPRRTAVSVAMTGSQTTCSLLFCWKDCCTLEH